MNLKIAVAMLLALSSSLVASPSKIARDLSSLLLPNGGLASTVAGNADVIIRFREIPGSTQNGKVQRAGGALKRILRSARAGAYSVPLNAVLQLAADPDVVYISPDRSLRSKLDYAEPTTNANLAFAQGFTGSGVTVAVIDSGITTHDDLGSRILYSQSFVPGDLSTADAYGHGTHVAGIIAGNAADSSGPGFTRQFLGIAPAASLVNLRVLDGNGQGADSSVIAAIDQAIALKDVYNIRVINLSLGRAVYETYLMDPLCIAVEQAWFAGITVVVAAGNEGRDNSFGNYGYGTIAAPANDPYVITVRDERQQHRGSLR